MVTDLCDSPIVKCLNNNSNMSLSLIVIFNNHDVTIRTKGVHGKRLTANYNTLLKNNVNDISIVCWYQCGTVKAFYSER